MVDWCRRDKVVLESGFDIRYISSLNDIFARDYRGSRPFKNDFASLDLDTIESDLFGDNDCTMDCAVGISKFDGLLHTQESLLLIEFRNDYKSTEHLERDRMSRKVSHSKRLLSPRRIHGESVFIFEDRVVNEARWWIRSYSNQYAEMKTWLVMSIAGFEEVYGIDTDFPYVPVTDLATLDREIRGAGTEAIQLYEVCEKWINYAATFKNRYVLPEVKAIVNVMETVLKDIVNNGICDDPEVVDILLDDVKRLM